MVPDRGGAVRFVRRHLGVEAFGINWFELPPGTEGPEHDQVASGQEEMSDGMAFVSVGARRGSNQSTCQSCHAVFGWNCISDLLGLCHAP
jgi:hypothetical protein